MKKKFYHATPMKNFVSILDDGKIYTGYEGVTYLCDTPKDAAKFVAIRGEKEILVCECEIDESLVSESFDHSEVFFKCKAYTYPKDISTNEITNYIKYEL